MTDRESSPPTTFRSLGLAPELLDALEQCGYSVPTPIQAKAIPHLLRGTDLMGCAQTGTGKTAAFALPILQQIRAEEPGHLRALILVPTRELAMQVQKNIQEYGRSLPLRSTAVFGGVPFEPQIMMLRHGVDILVATPGRLKDHIWRGLIDFRDTRFLVLDEADRMLDLGFIDAVREIIDLMPRERQTMLFSATLEPAIMKLARDILHEPVRVEVAPSATVAEGVEHRIVRVAGEEKRTALVRLLRGSAMERTLVFTKTKRGAQSLASHLAREGHRATSIHSDKSQDQRIAALTAFRTGRIQILVATDIAARGIDVTGISHVINFDVPHHPEDYVHRIGRTARAGRKGIAISLVTPHDAELIRSIERLIGTRLNAAVSAPVPAAREAAPPRERSRRAGEAAPAARRVADARREDARRTEPEIRAERQLRTERPPRTERQPRSERPPRSDRQPRRRSSTAPAREAPAQERKKTGALRRLLGRMGFVENR